MCLCVCCEIERHRQVFLVDRSVGAHAIEHIDGRKIPSKCRKKRNQWKKKNRLQNICKFIAYFCIVTLTFHKVVSPLYEVDMKSKKRVDVGQRIEDRPQRRRKNPYKPLRYYHYLEHNSIYSPFQMHRCLRSFNYD